MDRRSDEEQERQDGEAGDVLRAGFIRQPDPRCEPTRKGPLDRLGMNGNTFGVESPFVDSSTPNRTGLENARSSRYNENVLSDSVGGEREVGLSFRWGGV